MAREERFNAVKAAYSTLGGFFKDVAQEIGMEKALAVYSKRGEAAGVMVAQLTKERQAGQGIDLKVLAAVESEGCDLFGLTYEIEHTPTSMKIIAHQCPIYDGFQSAGLDHQTIQQLCDANANGEIRGLNKAFPQLSGCAKFRSAPDQPCTEEFVLEK